MAYRARRRRAPDHTHRRARRRLTDADCLAGLLADNASPVVALNTYQANRAAPTAGIVHRSRHIDAMAGLDNTPKTQAPIG